MKHGIPEPEDLSEKEVYAFFGLASYYAQVVEQAVIHLAIILKISGKTAVTGLDIDVLFETFGRQSLGLLLTEARKLSPIPQDIDGKLSLVLEKRNHLMHHFFSEHSEDFMSEIGRSAMIEELRAAILLFQESDAALDTIVLPAFAKYGISAETIDLTYREMLTRAKSRDVAG